MLGKVARLGGRLLVVCGVVICTLLLSAISPGAPMAQAITIDQVSVQLTTLQSSANRIEAMVSYISNTQLVNLSSTLSGVAANASTAASESASADYQATQAKQWAQTASHWAEQGADTASAADEKASDLLNWAQWNNAAIAFARDTSSADHAAEAARLDGLASQLDTLSKSNTAGFAGVASSVDDLKGAIAVVGGKVNLVAAAVDQARGSITDLSGQVTGVALAVDGVSAKVEAEYASIMQSISSGTGGSVLDPAVLASMEASMLRVQALLEVVAGASCQVPLGQTNPIWGALGVDAGCVVTRAESEAQAEKIAEQVHELHGIVSSGLEGIAQGQRSGDDRVIVAVQGVAEQIQNLAGTVGEGMQAHADRMLQPPAGGGLSGPSFDKGRVQAWTDSLGCLGNVLSGAGASACGGVTVPIGFERTIVLLDWCKLPPASENLKLLVGALFIIACAWAGSRAIMAGFSYQSGS